MNHEFVGSPSQTELIFINTIRVKCKSLLLKQVK